MVDVLLALLRGVSRRRASLRLVVMSATLQTDTLATYLGDPTAPAATLRLPGSPRLPVVERHVDEIVDAIGARSRRDLGAAVARVIAEEERHVDAEERHVDGGRHVDAEGRHVDSERPVASALDAALCDLCAAIVRSLPVDGAVLCFLPGAEEIARVRDQIDDDRVHVHVLHARVAADEQMRALDPAPEGWLKVSTFLIRQVLTCVSHLPDLAGGPRNEHRRDIAHVTRRHRRD